MSTSILADIDSSRVFNIWLISLVIIVLAVVAIVWLIWGITKTALAIDQQADDIIVTALKIRGNTDPLSGLTETAKLAEALVGMVKGAEADGGAILARAAAGPGWPGAGA